MDASLISLSIGIPIESHHEENLGAGPPCAGNIGVVRANPPFNSVEQLAQCT